MVTNQVARAYDWSGDALKVFDAPIGEGGGRISIQHKFDKDHQNYNLELQPFIDNYLNSNENKIDPSKMTADEARKMIAAIHKQPALRAFNVKMYLKGIWQSSRGLGGGKGDVD